MVMVVLGPRVTEELSANSTWILPVASVRRVSLASMGSLRFKAASWPPLSTKAPGITAVTWPMGAAKDWPANIAKSNSAALNCRKIFMGLAPVFLGAQVKILRHGEREKCLEEREPTYQLSTE